MVRDALESGNLFADLPDAVGGEVLDTLLSRKGVRIERIVSSGQTTPEGEWYDQDEDEWVIMLQGRARLRLEGEDRDRFLEPGDFAYLPAHCRHRVEETSAEPQTVWLAVHMETAAS